MASQSQGANGVPTGQQKPSTTWGEYNNMIFMVQQALAKMQTSTLVKIISCTNSGALSQVGYVDVQPMVNQVDGQGKPTPHNIIHNVPYLRIQGGSNAVIIDPQPGDIGICVFASRDISKVKNTRKAGNPGSLRQYSFSDGMYLGGVLNGEPSQYVQFNSAGIKMVSPTAIEFDAPDIKLEAATIELNATTSTTITTPTFTVNGATVLNGTLAQTGGGAATMSGTLNVTGDVTAAGTSLHTHHHGGVTTGGGNTGGPI